METLKHVAKELYFQTLYRLGISHPRNIRAESFLILTFHRVLPKELLRQYPLPGLAVTPDSLHWIVKTLMPYFDVCTVTGGRLRQQAGENVRPLLAITFDDGQFDNAAHGAPVLDALGVPGTFYLPTGFIDTDRMLWHDEVAFAWSMFRERMPSGSVLNDDGINDSSMRGLINSLKKIDRPRREAYLARLRESVSIATPDWSRMMNWKEVSALSQNGHEIGSHSVSHELLPQLDRERQREELHLSMQSIGSNLNGTLPRSFCYPNGNFDSITQELAREIGYDNAVTTQWGINSRLEDRFNLVRCDMDMRRLTDKAGRYSSARLAVRISGHQPGLTAPAKV